MRLEGWPRLRALRPSFETLASQAPQDGDCISSQARKERPLGRVSKNGKFAGIHDSRRRTSARLLTMRARLFRRPRIDRRCAAEAQNILQDLRAGEKPGFA